MGRPSSYSDEIAEEITERIANGESLAAICETEGFPSATSVYRWLETNTAFRERYTDARARQADYYADQIVTLADTADDHNKARLQIDARKWVSSKLLPKKYGDRTTTTHEGGDKPLQVENISDLDAARRIAFLFDKVTRSKE